MKNSSREEAAWQSLAFGSGANGPPAGGPPRVAANGPERKPKVTQIFNEAAKQPEVSAAVVQPVCKQQIEELRKRLSQPRFTLEMTPLGSVRKARSPEADRLLLKTLTVLSARLAVNKGITARFALAVKQGELKREFNRTSLGRGL
jgi:hypothetical protein